MQKPMTIKKDYGENPRDMVDGMPTVESRYEHIKWHMFHDVSYMFTSSNPMAQVKGEKE